MARASTQKTGSSKVRLIVFEAEMADGGDISGITQAIQNALQPRQPQIRVIQAPAAGAITDANMDEALDQADSEEALDEAPASPRPASKNSKPRTYRSPDVVDVDLDSETSFVEFASPKAPSTIADKYLTVAAWFKEHRDTPAVTADHVYTCFRKIGWSTSIDDFNAPFRKLKNQKFVSGDTSGFVINHLGLDKVRKLGQG